MDHVDYRPQETRGCWQQEGRGTREEDVSMRRHVLGEGGGRKEGDGMTWCRDQVCWSVSIPTRRDSPLAGLLNTPETN